MDMICGLPEEGMEELSYTLDEIKKLDPESLRSMHLQSSVHRD